MTPAKTQVITLGGEHLHSLSHDLSSLYFCECCEYYVYQRSLAVREVSSSWIPYQVAQGLSCNATFPLPLSELDRAEAPYLSHQL